MSSLPGSAHVDPSTSSSTSPPLSRLGRSALAYAERFGWHVFPLVPGAKTPLTPHGFKDASTDPEIITSWWTQHPDANIGVATGAVSGISVLDVDVKNAAGGDLSLRALIERSGEDLVEHVSQRTWSGGFQYVFAYDPRAKQGAGCYGKGLDGRNDGGYVVIPPSVIEGSAYEWIVKPKGEGRCASMPEWLLTVEKARPRSSQTPRGRVGVGARNDHLTSLAGTLRRRDMSEETVRATLLARNAEFPEPLDEAEVERIVQSAVKNMDPAAPAPARKLVVTNMADVPAEMTPWFWPERVPLGMITIVAGPPGVGKSYTTIDMIARTTRGDFWPDAKERLPRERAPQGAVILLAAEDSAKHTIKPRLMQQGADSSLVYKVDATMKEDGSGEASFSLAHDLALLEALVVETGATLIVVDPVNSYLGGKTDGWKDTEVRGVLDPVKRMAERLAVTVVLVMHLKKGEEAEIIYRIGGSVAWGAVARSVLFCSVDPEQAGRVYFSHPKTNVGPLARTLAYRIMGGKLEWDEEEIQLSARDVLDAQRRRPGPAPAKIDEAKRWLRDQLKDGPRPSAEMEQAALDAGISDATIRRAREALGVEAKMVRSGGRGKRRGTVAGWQWVMPIFPERTPF